MFNFLLHLFTVKNSKYNTSTFLFTTLSLKTANVNQNKSWLQKEQRIKVHDTILPARDRDEFTRS